MRVEAKLFSPGESRLERLGDQKPAPIAASKYRLAKPRPAFSVRVLVLFAHGIKALLRHHAELWTDCAYIDAGIDISFYGMLDSAKRKR
jgi:hypothetical protein